MIAVINQKGGVGKTTSAVNLSCYLAALGKYVLVVDIDPQANATGGLGHQPPPQPKPCRRYSPRRNGPHIEVPPCHRYRDALGWSYGWRAQGSQPGDRQRPV